MAKEALDAVKTAEQQAAEILENAAQRCAAIRQSAAQQETDALAGEICAKAQANREETVRAILERITG